MLGPVFFSYAIDYPAWLIGTILGGLAYLAVVLGGLLVAIYSGIAVYRLVRIPLINWIAAIAMGLWIACIAVRSLNWMAAGIFSTLEHRDDE